MARHGVARALGGVLSAIIIVLPGTDGTGPGTDGTGTESNGTVRVGDAASLTSALATAKPGQTIELADGTYLGGFTIGTSGLPGRPITLTGSRHAVLDGRDLAGGYDLQLSAANYWRLVGFTVTGGQKGIMTDRTNHTVLSGLDVGNTGQEAVHFGNFSSDNVLRRSILHDTGRRDPQFGEGLYLGTATSDWARRSGGRPDNTDRNQAIGNTFRNTTAENIDVKEATSGGLISGNSFDGSGVSGANFADSVLDVKGVGYRIADNVTSGGSANLKDGFQTHVIADPATSGCGNTFQNNTFDLDLAGGEQIALDGNCGGGPAPAGP